MPRARTLFLSTFSALLACADAPLEPAIFAEHCGERGPVRLLELTPGQSLGHHQRIGERLYHTIGTLAPSPYSAPSVEFTGRSTWSTGLCGESPLHLADDLVSVFTVERWPGLVFGCQEGAGIVSLDPTGASPPHLLFASPQCYSAWADALTWTDHGVVGLVDPTAPTTDLQLFPFPDDPRTDVPEPIVLIPDVDPTVLTRTWPDAVHAVTAAGELVRVDLDDRELHVEQTDVRAFEYSADRRYLLWMDTTPLAEERGLVLVRDTTTGITTALGESLNPPSPFSLRFAEQGLLLFDGSRRIYFLPDLSFLDVPGGFSLDYRIGPLDDDRWPMLGFSRLFSSKLPSLALFDLKDGAVTPLFGRDSWLLGAHQDGLLVLDSPLCCIKGTYRSEGPLWHVPLDAAEPRKLADRATAFHHLPDPLRLITGVDIAKDRRGALILTDLDTRAEQRIDHHVLFGSADLAPADDPTRILWTVHDGARSGIWTARLPPP